MPLAPFLGSGGTAVTRQARPSQCSASGWLTAWGLAKLPTAHPSLALDIDAPANWLSSTLVGSGLTLRSTCQIPGEAAWAPVAPAAVARARAAAAARLSSGDLTICSVPFRMPGSPVTPRCAPDARRSA